jgi:hypothetical protein
VGVGIDGDDLQFHVGRLPDPFPHGPHNGQNLSGDIPMTCVHKSPEGGLHRQPADFENARKDRIASDEAQLVQPRKADVEAEHDSQQEPVQIHGAGNPLGCQGLFHQGLESELLQHGDHRQHSAVRSQVLAVEVKGRGSIDFIGFGSSVLRALFSGRFAAILFSVRNHLGDLLGAGFCEGQTSHSPFYLNVLWGPQMVRYAPAFRSTPVGAYLSW